jgi:hypothetical protein
MGSFSSSYNSRVEISVRCNCRSILGRLAAIEVVNKDVVFHAAVLRA